MTGHAAWAALLVIAALLVVTGFLGRPGALAAAIICPYAITIGKPPNAAQKDALNLVQSSTQPANLNADGTFNPLTSNPNYTTL